LDYAGASLAPCVMCGKPVGYFIQRTRPKEYCGNCIKERKRNAVREHMKRKRIKIESTK